MILSSNPSLRRRKQADASLGTLKRANEGEGEQRKEVMGQVVQTKLLMTTVIVTKLLVSARAVVWRPKTTEEEPTHHSGGMSVAVSLRIVHSKQFAGSLPTVKLGRS
jgi:hypothetical protein